MAQIKQIHLKDRYLQEIQLPIGSKILCVQNRMGIVILTALVDPDQPLETRLILVWGETDGPLPSNDVTFIDSYQETTDDAIFIWYVFELSEMPKKVNFMY